MKTDSENFYIKSIVDGFNDASDSAGFSHTMVYHEEEEKIIIDGNEELSINLWMNSVSACFRDIVRGLNRLIENGEAYQ